MDTKINSVIDLDQDLVNTIVSEIWHKSTNHPRKSIKNIVHAVQNMLQCNIFAVE